MKTYIVGSLNMDLVIKAPYMPENGVTMTGEGFMTNPGGKGSNQAAAVGKLGGNAYMVGCVGDSFGDELITTLKSYNVNVDYVEKLTGISSGIAVIVVVDGDNRIILDKGANDKVSTELIDSAFSTAEEGDYVICQLEIPQEMIKYTFEVAKKKGLITVLNPAPATTIIDGILQNTDYLIPNQSETETFTGIYPKDEETAKKAAKKLSEFGVKNVIITMGGEGSCAIVDGVYYKANSFKVNAIDTTAAGDTFIGALITGLSEKMDIKTAMTFASKASSITVTRSGAQQSIPTRDEVNI